MSTILFHKNYSKQGLFGIPSIIQNYYKYRNFSKSDFNFNSYWRISFYFKLSSMNILHLLIMWCTWGKPQINNYRFTAWFIIINFDPPPGISPCRLFVESQWKNIFFIMKPQSLHTKKKKTTMKTDWLKFSSFVSYKPETSWVLIKNCSTLQHTYIIHLYYKECFGPCGYWPQNDHTAYQNNQYNLMNIL